MKQRKHPFSLLELIIVMGILAVLASLLLENFADVKSRACEEQTFEKGNHIRTMIKGSPREEGIGAFLSDMGRFPSLYIPSEGDGSGGRRLAELYDPSVWYHSTAGSALQKERSISASDIQTILRSVTGSTFPASGLYYPEVSMNVGWNGPYINIGSPVKGNYFDGWGNPWKIISNYNYKTESSRLTENTSGSNALKVYAASAEISALRDTTANKRCRIDGIISYGANDADDSAGTDTAAADADQKFLFPHNMDNHSSENMAALTVTLKIRDEKSGQWVMLPAISSWQSNTSYAKGALAAYNGALYCALSVHTSGSTFSASNWAALSTAAAYSSGFTGDLCIYDNTYYLRNSAASETEFTPANWLRIAGVREIPENVSLLLFTPVMQGSYDERRMELGYYHFYRNMTQENTHGVRPLYGTAGSADIDCDSVDVNIRYGASDDYNGRYLTAEDHSSSSWNRFFIKRVIPGRRKIFCMTYNSSTRSCFQSQAELVPLKPGSNFLTLYLEQK